MKTYRCPHCNARIKIEPSRPTPSGTSKRRRSTTFQSAVKSNFRNTSAALPAPLYQPPISSPVGLPTLESHVHVPVNQSIISGCLVAPVVALSIFAAAIYIYDAPAGEALLLSFLSGGITCFVTAARKWNRKTAFYDSLLMVEQALDLDLDGDGDIGPPALKVEVTSDGGNRWQFADLPGSPTALREFAKRVLMGQGFTDETGAMAGLSQREVKDLRAAFVEKGWAGWKHPTRRQLGIDVLHVGRAVLRAIAGSSPAPLGAAEA